jgi:hypothetical protein
LSQRKNGLSFGQRLARGGGGKKNAGILLVAAHRKLWNSAANGTPLWEKAANGSAGDAYDA